MLQLLSSKEFIILQSEELRSISSGTQKTYRGMVIVPHSFPNTKTFIYKKLISYFYKEHIASLLCPLLIVK